MKKSDFNARVKEMCDFIKRHDFDDMSAQLKPFAKKFGGLQGAFVYGMWCEKNFEANLRSDYKRKTTYTSDFSLAEWCVPVDGMKTIASTLRNALTNWRDDVEFFAEIVIVINKKSWEHAARHNNNYGRMYSDLYYMVRDLYFDWFDEEHPKHAKAIDYYFKYID